jgi:hypothetical protein
MKHLTANEQELMRKYIIESEIDRAYYAVKDSGVRLNRQNIVMAKTYKDQMESLIRATYRIE